MSSGGVFNSVIKSNKSIMIDKSKRFKKTLGGFERSKSPYFKFKNATPEQLNEIKERIQLENKRNTIKQITAIVVITPIILLFSYIQYMHSLR